MTPADDIRRLHHQARSRPGDPVAWAQLAVALHAVDAARAEGVLTRPEADPPDTATPADSPGAPVHADPLETPDPGDPGDAFDAQATLTHTFELVRNCLGFGLIGPAEEAAELLHTAFGDEATAILLAEVTLRRNQVGDIDRARRLLEATVEHRPDAREARVRAAALALGTGDHDAARRWIEPVAADNAGTRALYAQILLAEGDVEAAAHEALLGLEGAPEAVDLHLLLGVAELAQSHNEAAIESFSEALRLAPERPEAYYNLGLAFVATGSRAAALGVVEAGLELAPDDERLQALHARLRRPVG